MPLNELSVALVGIGGFGQTYLRALLPNGGVEGVRFIAAADSAAERCEMLPEVQEAGVPIFPSLEALLEKSKPDLMVLSTPPQVHAQQVIASVQRGCHVLVEKPAACDPQQVREMIAARDKANKQVAVGYQWSFSPAILKLKSDVMSGRFGKPKKLRTSVYWPRNEAYYSRNDWAGRQRDSQGLLVLDSPVNNACSHFLHNMFFVLGPVRDRSDEPVTVQAELYRANKIDNYDTAAIRCITRSGAELLFYTSHATHTSQEPLIHYEFEKAVVRYVGQDGNELIATMADGTTIRYGHPLEAISSQKLQDVCNSIRAGTPVACGLEAASPQNICMFASQESTPQIVEFPRELIVIEGEPGSRMTYVPELESGLNRCYERAKLPSELSLSWAKPGKLIRI
jgi:predicted dehydrogenase